MSTAVVTDLVAALADRQAECETAYRQLAQRIVDAQPVDQEEAIAVLRTAGRSAADLERDVAKVRRIRELQTVIAEKPEVEARRIAMTGARVAEIEREREDQRRAARQALEFRIAEGPINVKLLEIALCPTGVAQIA